GYAFGKVNASTPGYLRQLHTYFNALKVQIEAEEDAGPPTAAAAPEATGPSIAEFIFADYFAMIARQGAQAMKDGLANFLLAIADFPGRTTQEIVDHINARSGLTGPGTYSV